MFHVRLLISLSLLAFMPKGQEQRNYGNSEKETQMRPTIMVVLLVRNKAHTLPYFLHYFEKLDYPKHRMSLWIRADHNIDHSVDIMLRWLERVELKYHWVDYKNTDHNTGYPNEENPCDWTEERFTNIINLRQQALDVARRAWADYVFFTDLDNILVNDQVLNDLIMQEKTIIAPMLNATASEHYSNFWGAMDEDGYYSRSANYKDIQLRHIQGCFQVVLVHSTLLVDLRREESRYLAYHPSPPGYRGPYDDLIIFAHSAKYHGVTMHILNSNFYGFMQIPMTDNETLLHEREQFIHLRLEAIIYKEPLQKIEYLDHDAKDPVPSKLGFDNIYMVNLARRSDRREKMKHLFTVLGIDAQFIKAVDGKQLNYSYLTSLGIEMLPDFSDPFTGRPMTLGEIGCFLSHYGIWEDMIKKQYEKVLIFEDDVRFEMYFKYGLSQIMKEVKQAEIDWDLIYIGRKRLKHKSESWVAGTNRLVWPHYSYWTLGYALSLKGASKLLAQDPLRRMVPVDEFLPIMFNRHIEPKWLERFSPRELVALSAEPLLIYPTHYTGEPGYFTDTEDSDVISEIVNTHGSPESDLHNQQIRENSEMMGPDGNPAPKVPSGVHSVDEL